MACYVEAILGYLGSIMGHHCRSGSHGQSNRSIRLQNVSHLELDTWEALEADFSKYQLHLYITDHDPGMLPFLISHCP